MKFKFYFLELELKELSRKRVLEEPDGEKKKRGRPKGSNNSNIELCLVCGESRNTNKCENRSGIACVKCQTIGSNDARYKTLQELEESNFPALPSVNQFSRELNFLGIFYIP